LGANGAGDDGRIIKEGEGLDFYAGLSMKN
jgi:hypothetical protein